MLPEWIHTLWLRIKALFRHGQLDRDLNDELEFHLAMREQKLAESGVPPEEAHYTARREFGNPMQAKETNREMWTFAFLEALLQDLRYGLRQLRRNPGFTAVAVITLALGIGANTAIFSVTNSLVFRNLPVRSPQQLVLLTNPDSQGGWTGFQDGERDFLTYPEFQEIERYNRVFSGLLAASSFTTSIPVEIEASGQSAEATPAQVKLVSGSYFSVLGVNAILGRTFTTEVDRLRDANPVAVISYGFWKGRFGGARDVIGRKIGVLKTSYTVIGVTPPHFHGETVGANPEIFVPLTMQSEILPGADYLSPETNHFDKTEWLQVIGRRKTGITLAQAKASIAVEFRQMMQTEAAGMSPHDKTQFLNQRLPVAAGSRGASSLRGHFSKPLEILMAVVGLILLIACANISNILLARAAARQKEIAVRVALGAGGLRLFRQMLTESILLAVMGGAFGLLLAQWADTALLFMVSGGEGQLPLDLHPNGKILAFTLGISLLTGILFGLAPAFRATRMGLNSVLKAASRGVTGRTSRPGRAPIGKILVVAQVALSLSLVMVAVLFLRSFRNLAKVQLGFDRDHLVQFRTDALTYGYRRAEVLPLYNRVLQRIRGLPGVRGASLCDNGLLSGFYSQERITIEGVKPTAADQESRYDAVGPNFFSAAGIAILVGREIGPQDSGNRQRVGVVNQTFVQDYLAGSSPLGKRVVVHQSKSQFDFVIVGVAADSKHNSVREKPFPRFSIPFFDPVGNAWPTRATFVVRTFGDPASVSSAIRAAVKEAAANLPPVTTETLDQRLAQSLTTDRMITELSGAFGALAIILVCIGLYGIMAYSVAGRTQEIGIRIALGAQRSGVLWLILRESLLLVFAGLVIGIPAVSAAGRWISSLLFEVKPADPTALGLATLLMFLIGILACYIPARRATRIDPMEALRYE